MEEMIRKTSQAERRAIARKLLLHGKDTVEEIAWIVELSVDEIRELVGESLGF